MEKEILREKLLKTGLFIENEFLDQYLDLVIDYATVNSYVEGHHILQRVYYKHNKLEVDNSTDNMVYLAYADHCKAHWLLYWCTKSFLRNANAWTVQYMQTSYKKFTGKDKRKFEFVQEDFELLEYYFKSIKTASENLFWTEEDLAILKAEYSKVGAEGLVNKLAYPRSIQAIRLQASILKLSSPVYWTEEELQILRQYYPEEGYRCYKRLNNKSKQAVQGKAFRLGLESTWDWTDKEIARLKQYYPLYGYKCKDYLCHKSVAKIKAKALELNLSNPYEAIWSDHDVNILLTQYKTCGTKCAVYMETSHTPTQIYNKVRELKRKGLL